MMLAAVWQAENTAPLEQLSTQCNRSVIGSQTCPPRWHRRNSTVADRPGRDACRPRAYSISAARESNEAGRAPAA